MVSNQGEQADRMAWFRVHSNFTNLSSSTVTGTRGVVVVIFIYLMVSLRARPQLHWPNAQQCPQQTANESSQQSIRTWLGSLGNTTPSCIGRSR